MAKDKLRYGLQLTNNSKTGPAFSLPRSATCIHKTPTCWRVCYGRGVRYQTETHKQKREQNYRTVQFLLENGGPELLAENLIHLIDQARPSDWLTAQIANEATETPWTLRIQDVGDFYSIDYVAAWTIAVKKRPLCSFWFYTRSFLEAKLFQALTQLAAQPNCQGWLSLDQDNYEAGILAFTSSNGVWKIALLQEQEELMPPQLIPQLSAVVSTGELVSFPKHASGRHVPEIKAPNMTICPQVLGAYPLENNPSRPRPCQACAFCLP